MIITLNRFIINNMGPKRKIVILGAGFGGIKAAFSICRAIESRKLQDKYELVLVDKNFYHTYTPTLYEVATTSKETASQVNLEQIVTFSIPQIFKGRCLTFLQKTVAKVDLIGGDVHFHGGEKLKFDYLVFALGAETNYFDIPGLKENSLSLKTFKDAILIREKILGLVYEIQPSQELKILVGGGGATGIELAGEIQSWLIDLNKEFKKFRFSVKIVEAAPAILSGFDKRVAEKVTRRLKKINVEVLAGETIEKVEPNKVFLKSQKTVDFDILIWTGGVKAVSLMAELPLKKEQRGKVEVVGEMWCLPHTPDLKLYGKIYGLGDAVCSYNPETGKPVPLIAEAAIEQAKVVAHNILEDIKVEEGLAKLPDYKKYRPEKEFPYIIPVGGKFAVAKWGPLVLSGFSGWILKGLVEIYYLLFNVLPPFQAIKIWLKGLWIFTRNDRLG
jgi:NADH dehydrogenase